MVLALASVVVYTSISIRNLTDDLAEERAAMISQSTHLRFDELTDISALSTRVVAQSDILANVIIDYAATGVIDRAALLEYLEKRRMEIGAGLFLLLDNNGITIIRTILPAMFGDSQTGSVNVRAAMRGENRIRVQRWRRGHTYGRIHIHADNIWRSADWYFYSAYYHERRRVC